MDERRGDDRKPTYRSGTIRIDGESQNVTILNLSGSGAMVDAASAIPEDAGLVFDCSETGETAARVAWVIGKRCGLTFDHIVTLDGVRGDDVAA